MKKHIKTAGMLLIVSLLLISCSSNASLQQYYADNRENENFIAIDLPSSIIQLKSEEVSEEVQQTLSSIKKLKFLAFPVNDNNRELYSAERTKVKEILKNPAFKTIASMNSPKGNVKICYTGEEDAIDEVVVFGSEKNSGFALIRVLGDDMNPADILRISQEVKFDDDSQQLQQMANLFQGLGK